jgi:hypothetical protein
MTLEKAREFAEANLRLEGQSVSPFARTMLDSVTDRAVSIQEARLQITRYYETLCSGAE